MLYGHILIAHGLSLILGIDQYLIQVIADIKLTPSAYLRKLFKGLLCFIFKEFSLDAHFCNQLHNQAVLQGQKAVQQMGLIDLLVAILVSQLLTVLHCFH